MREGAWNDARGEMVLHNTIEHNTVHKTTGDVSSLKMPWRRSNLPRLIEFGRFLLMGVIDHFIMYSAPVTRHDIRKRPQETHTLISGRRRNSGVVTLKFGTHPFTQIINLALVSTPVSFERAVLVVWDTCWAGLICPPFASILLR